MGHLEIVENHAFSQEGEGAQNCLCRKVGPFVEAWMYLATTTYNPPHWGTLLRGELDAEI